MQIIVFYSLEYSISADIFRLSIRGYKHIIFYSLYIDCNAVVQCQTFRIFSLFVRKLCLLLFGSSRITDVSVLSLYVE